LDLKVPKVLADLVFAERKSSDREWTRRENCSS